MAKRPAEPTTPTVQAEAATPADRLRDAADELTKPRRRSVYLEYYDPKAKRRVRRRTSAGRISLIAVLENDVTNDDDTAPKRPGGGGSGGFGSKPPGHYAPRELLDHLERDLGYWIDWCGFEGWRTVEQRVRALSGVADNLDVPVLGELTAELERWGEQLRRYAGVERVFRPRATCPRCTKRGELTVWIDEDSERAERAVCGACRTTWDRATVGLLIEHVRFETSPPPPPKVDLIKHPRPAQEVAA